MLIDSFRYKLFFILDNSVQKNAKLKEVLELYIIDCLCDMKVDVVNLIFDGNCIILMIDICFLDGKSPSRLLNILKNRLKAMPNTKECYLRKYKIDKIDFNNCYLMPVNIIKK